MEQTKAAIENLQQAFQSAKEKQKLAQEEFKNNKEGKIDELKVQLYFRSLPFPFHKQHTLVQNTNYTTLSRDLIFWLISRILQASINKQKSALQKHAVIVKAQHKDLQTATLELGKLFYISQQCARSRAFWTQVLLTAYHGQ